MPRRSTLALLALTGSALLMTGASAQQLASQGTQPADGQTVVCPRGGPMGSGPEPMGSGMVPGPMAGQTGEMMGMHRDEMRQMHTEMTALREEMRLLQEELRSRR